MNIIVKELMGEIGMDGLSFFVIYFSFKLEKYEKGQFFISYKLVGFGAVLILIVTFIATLMSGMRLILGF